MSIFEGNDNNNEEKNWLEELVGEGKKFKSVEDLAKSKNEADQFIERLKEENQEMRKDLDSRMTVEEALLKLQKEREVSTPNVPDDNTNQDRQGGKDEIDLDKLIEEKLSSKQREERAIQNQLECDKLMKEKFGDKAREVMETVSKDKGISLEFIKATAEQSPKAFQSLMGLDQSTTPFRQTSGSVNTQALGMNNQGDRLEELKALRKSNPKEFWKPHIQNEIHKLSAQRMSG